MRLSDAQLRWLQAPGDCAYEHRDRTFQALLRKGAVEIVNRHYSQNARQQFRVTPAGQAALAQSQDKP